MTIEFTDLKTNGLQVNGRELVPLTGVNEFNQERVTFFIPTICVEPLQVQLAEMVGAYVTVGRFRDGHESVLTVTQGENHLAASRTEPLPELMFSNWDSMDRRRRPEW